MKRGYEKDAIANSDADLNIQRVNANNYYKDKIRMIEILARQQKIENEEKS